MLAEWSVRINNHLQKSEGDYILSCVSCDQCVKQISLEAIKYAIKNTRSDEYSPVKLTKDVSLHELASNGRTELIEYLLEIDVQGSDKR